MSDESQIQEKTEGKQEEKTVEEKPKETDTPVERKESPAMVVDANKAAERIEKANEATAENLKKMEQIQAENILAGKGRAGQEVTPTIVSPEEYSRQIENGEVNPLTDGQS